MPDETERPYSNLDFVRLEHHFDMEIASIREYFQIELAGTKEYFNARLQAMADALKVAADSMNQRLEGMNEFRAQMKDQAATFITRNEFAGQHDRVLEDVRVLRENEAKQAGKASQQSVEKAMSMAVVGWVIGGIATVVSIIAVILRFMGK